MLTYSFENKGDVPLYVYLYNGIKDDILCGKLKPNEKLPSKRNLAQHLKISIITVENSYAQLILEGYIYSVEKKGYFVSTLQETLPAASAVLAQSGENIRNTSTAEYEFDFKSNVTIQSRQRYRNRSMVKT